MNVKLWQKRIWRRSKYVYALFMRALGEWKDPPKAVFVLGAQRSGTRLLMVVMDHSPLIGSYSEGNSTFFDGVLMKQDREVIRRLEKMPYQVVALKPIAESHRACEFLERFPYSKVVWIYRDYRYAARSAMKKWKGGVHELSMLALGKFREAGWRVGGLTEEKLALVREIYSPDMSKSSAHAMKWFLRTSLFVDMKLADRDDVMLVKYEDLVTDPLTNFEHMFSFLGVPFRNQYVKEVYATSVATGELTDLDPRVEVLCQDLMDKMDECYCRMKKVR